MNVLKAGAMSALLGTLLFGCEGRNPAAVSDGVTGPDAGTGVSAKAGSHNALMRWDIISIDFATGTASAGGVARAFANDNSKIRLTGTGTFRSNPQRPLAVTGGGRWTTFAPDGSRTGSGRYEVTGFVSFVVAPGTFPLPHDNIGDPDDARAGLVVLKISYSDGSDGVLIVSCELAGTPHSVFEGVTASKGFVDYWNREAPPAPPGNRNRTLFHILR
jgi:hypothetical protein